MNSLRNILIGGILVVSFLLVIEWNNFQERNAELASPSNISTSSNAFENPAEHTADIPDDLGEEAKEVNQVPQAGSNVDEQTSIDDLPVVENTATSPVANSPISTELVEVKTDNLLVKIDPKGGDIVYVALPKHLAKLNAKNQPFVMLDRNASHTYVATSGLVGINGPDKSGKPLYEVNKRSYELSENSDVLTVDFVLDQDSAQITKRFTFTKNSYLINVEFIVKNNSGSVWQANLFGQIKRDNYVPGKTNSFAMSSFTGYATTTTETNYKKISVKDATELKRDDFKESKENGWMAFVQHYFVSAWIPEKGQSANYRIFGQTNNINIGDFVVTKPLVIASGESGSTKADFYVGPKDLRELQKLAPHLDKTLDYGFLWFIAKPLFYAMDNIHSHVGNWGIAIILITLAIKAVFFYPSALSYRSMAKMRKVQPLMTELKERYGDDRQRMSTELMKLYKKEKVNPLSGCLPILLQMPVFIALYWMIMESVELRHSPFYFWIQDLSVKDPYFVLPLLMGVSMFIQQKLNPTPPDPMQAKIMQMLPIVFTFLFLFFPSGLVLYWVVNNTLSIAQQYVITRQIENAT